MKSLAEKIVVGNKIKSAIARRRLTSAEKSLRKAVLNFLHSHPIKSEKRDKSVVLALARDHGFDPRKRQTHLLLKTILIDTLIGDRRLKVANIREVLARYRNLDQLLRMVRRQFGGGTIGSKALGLEASYAILSSPEIQKKYGFTMPVHSPQSYYLGSNLLLEFIRHNESTLGPFRKLKYEKFAALQAVQSEVEEAFRAARMPAHIHEYLERIVDEIRRPIIVRSSSKLEDNPDASFAGKYESYFLANEGPCEERLAQLEEAVKKIWRSVFSPDAIIYRQKMGLMTRDEQMGILLQKVIGRKFEVVYPDAKTGKTVRRRLFAPVIAGVGFSRNMIYILSTRMKQEDGMVRMVLGLGTRAVDRHRAYEVSLSLPGFFPERHPYRKQKMTQSTMDCLDLERNELVHVPVSWAALYSGKFYEMAHPFLSIVKEFTERPLTSQYDIRFEGTPEKRVSDNIIINFHRLLQNHTKWAGYDFPDELRRILRALEENLGYPVDIEFCFNTDVKGSFRFYLLQSRAQLHSEGMEPIRIPRCSRRDTIIDNPLCLTNGRTREGSEFLLYVDSVAYKRWPDKSTIARAIGKIVHHPRVQAGGCIAIMPGRTGSNNPDLGVPVNFSEISELRALIEYGDDVLTTDISYGTHFYSEIRDVHIQFMPVQRNDPFVHFNDKLLLNAPSITRELLPGAGVEEVIRVIHLTAVFPPKKAFLYLNGIVKKGALVMHR